MGHPEEVLDALRGFYSKGLSTDIGLQFTSNEVLHCWRVALCAHSSYLRVMFTAAMRTNSFVRYVWICERQREDEVIMDWLCQLQRLKYSYSVPHCHLRAISIDPPCASASTQSRTSQVSVSSHCVSNTKYWRRTLLSASVYVCVTKFHFGQC